jgi:hypothetical protein
VHDDDKAAILMVGKMKPLLIKKLMSEYRFMRLTAKLHGSWDSLF